MKNRQTRQTSPETSTKLVPLEGQIIPNPTHLWYAEGDADSQWLPLETVLTKVKEKSGRTLIWTENILVPENKQKQFAKALATKKTDTLHFDNYCKQLTLIYQNLELRWTGGELGFNVTLKKGRTLPSCTYFYAGIGGEPTKTGFSEYGVVIQNDLDSCLPVEVDASQYGNLAQFINIGLTTELAKNFMIDASIQQKYCRSNLNSITTIFKQTQHPALQFPAEIKAGSQAVPLLYDYDEQYLAHISNKFLLIDSDTLKPLDKKLYPLKAIPVCVFFDNSKTLIELNRLTIAGEYKYSPGSIGIAVVHPINFKPYDVTVSHRDIFMALKQQPDNNVLLVKATSSKLRKLTVEEQKLFAEAVEKQKQGEISINRNLIGKEDETISNSQESKSDKPTLTQETLHKLHYLTQTEDNRWTLLRWRSHPKDQQTAFVELSDEEKARELGTLIADKAKGQFNINTLFSKKNDKVFITLHSSRLNNFKI